MKKLNLVVALAHLTHIDASKLDYRLNDVTFEVACDVTNPLLGSNGATYIYGPQREQLKR